MSELLLRQRLAATYRIFARLGFDDLTYTHLSARLPGQDTFFIYPLGMFYEEVTASSLLKVTLDGKIIEGTEAQYNRTGYTIHGAIYQNRPELNAVYHLHSTAGVAVSAMHEGLLPLSQFAFHFYQRHAYHNYDSLALDAQQHGAKMATDLGPHKVMFLRNHGTLLCGETLQEAFFYAYYLEQACRVQLAAMSTGRELIMPPATVCKQAARDMRDFEKELGQRDWQGLLRKLEREEGIYYKD